MERYELETFLALAEELHFGRTADRLHVSRAHVSQTIKRIERRIGASLFERTSRRVALTPLGQQLYNDLSPHYLGIQRATARASAAARGDHTTLTLGVTGSMAPEITEIMRRFRTLEPNCDLRFREIPFRDPFGGLRSGDIDLILAWLPIRESDLAAGPTLFTAPMSLAVSDSHPLAAYDSVCVEDLAEYVTFSLPGEGPAYWLEYLPRHTPTGRPIRRGPELPDTMVGMFAEVASGNAVAAVHTPAQRYQRWPGIRLVPFRDAPPAEWALVWRRATETARIRALVDAASKAG